MAELRIISKSAITSFARDHSDSLQPLLYWHAIARRAAWRHLTDVRVDFPHADFVDPFTVFNVSGNKYRLIALINFKWQIVYIRHILTHGDYDKEKWKR